MTKLRTSRLLTSGIYALPDVIKQVEIDFYALPVPDKPPSLSANPKPLGELVIEETGTSGAVWANESHLSSLDSVLSFPD